MRGFQAVRYIFFETLPAFIMGVVIFVSILLMFQALRLTEFVLVHGVGIKTILQIMLYLSVSFLPVILPMSLLFSVLLTYSRLSNDSEIVALKSLGLSMLQLTVPAILLAAAATLMSAQTSFYLGPWGNRKFEVLINELGQQKAGATIKDGVFSEGFFDMVVYANKVDSKAQ
jgi:lipopolysaccharide export system permease protein